MIDKSNYGTELIEVFFSIGGIEDYIIKEKVFNQVRNYPQIASFSVVKLNNTSVLYLKLHTQVIPELIISLSKENIAIYQVSEYK